MTTEPPVPADPDDPQPGDPVPDDPSRVVLPVEVPNPMG